MFHYLLRRILLFIPTLLLVSMLAFALSRLAPGDQVLLYLQSDPFGAISKPGDLLQAEKNYAETARKLNLDKPAFYFAMTSRAFPDTLHRIFMKDRREVLERLISQYGNWPEVESYYHHIRTLELELLALPDSLDSRLTSFKLDLRDLYAASSEGVIAGRFEKMEKVLRRDPILTTLLGEGFSGLKGRYENMVANRTPGKLNIPVLHWYGLNNQYHHWLTNFITGDFGMSAYDRAPVARKVGPALVWTVTLTLSAILLAFLVAVPLGVWSAVKRGKRFDKVTSMVLFMLYSLPSFWIGTLLLIFFTTREYGMDIFPGPGLGNPGIGAGWWDKLTVAFPHLFLPVICIAYPALAFISRQARGGMVSVLEQDYIKTARAKGLSEGKVIWKHAFRNALFPLITMFAMVLPASIAGSITTEYIFNIPGMGLTTYTAIIQQDWSVVFAILMLGALLTITGILLADVLYALADPRVRFGKK